MPRRAYRPEFSGCLEGRASPSSLAAPAAAPVVLPLRRLDLATLRVQLSFSAFARVRDASQLRLDLDSDVAPIPFRQAYGLGGTIDRIVDRMEEDLADHIPRAVQTAQREVLAAVRQSVAQGVRSGVVVVR